MTMAEGTSGLLTASREGDQRVANAWIREYRLFCREDQGPGTRAHFRAVWEVKRRRRGRESQLALRLLNDWPIQSSLVKKRRNRLHSVNLLRLFLFCGIQKNASPFTKRIPGKQNIQPCSFP